MEATKVQVREELIKFKPLSSKAKSQLRQQRIIELIEKKPYMSRISGVELGAAAQLSDTNVWRLVHSMARKNKIVMHPLGLRSYALTVPGKTTVIRPPTALTEVHPELPKPAATGGGTSNLADYAKDFAWTTNSDSLREFITWMDGKELELLRGSNNDKS